MKKVIFLVMIAEVTLPFANGLQPGQAVFKKEEETRLKETIAEMRSAMDKLSEEHEALARKVDKTEKKAENTCERLQNLGAFTEKFYEGTRSMFSRFLRGEQPEEERSFVSSADKKAIQGNSALSQALTLFSATEEESHSRELVQFTPPPSKRKKTEEALRRALVSYSSTKQPIIEEPQDE